MGRAFRDFLVKQNALALAVGVIIGASIGRVVASLVADIVMPLISLGLPAGDWRAARIVLSESIGPDGKPVVNSINYGIFGGTIIDFVIVAFAVFMIVRYVLRPAPDAPTKTCPYCAEIIPAEAKKCKACTSTLT
jgi:large conductance mechanosensitive channel